MPKRKIVSAAVAGSLAAALAAGAAFADPLPADISSLIGSSAEAASISGVSDGEYVRKVPSITISATKPIEGNLQAALLKGSDVVATADISSGQSLDLSKVDEAGTYSIVAWGQYKESDGSAKNFAVKKTFKYDKADPDIKIDGVKDGVYLNADTTLKVTASDDLDIDNDSVSAVLTKDGKDTDITKEMGKGVKISDEGSYTLTVKAKDKAGRDAEKKISFKLDKTAPEIEGGSFLESTGVQKLSDIKVRSKDENPDKITITAEQVVNKGEKAAKYTASGTDQVSLSEPGENGTTWDVTVDAVDKAGNETKKTKRIVVDTSAPSAEISGAEDGKFYNKAITLKGSAKDDNLKRQKLEVKKDGKEVKVNGTSVSLTGDGHYEATFTAEDKAGNITKKTISFVIDTKAPGVTVSGQANGSCTGAPAAVSAASDEDATVYMTVKRGSEEVATLSGENSVSFDEPKYHFDGTYTFVIYAIDRAGNKSASQVWTVTKDTKAPVLSDSGITDGKFYSAAPTCSASADDDNLDSFTLSASGPDGTQQVEGKGGKLSWTPKKDGNYSLILTARDKSGNVTTKTHSFTLDTVSPETKITGSKESGGTLPDGAKIRLTTENEANPSEIHYIVKPSSGDASKEQTVSGSSADVDASLCQNDGMYTITAWSVDKAGNVGKKVSYSFIRDGKAPDTSIKGAEDGNYYNKASLPSITASAKDEHLKTVTLEVTGDNGYSYRKTVSEGGSITYLPGSKSDPNAESFKDGVYTVSITAEDDAGNVSSKKQLQFTYDNTNPETEISSADSANAVTRSPAQVTVKGNDRNPDKVYMTVTRTDQATGKTVTLQKAKEGNLQETFDSFSEDGLYEVTAYSVDKAGNKSKEENFKVIKDTKAPDISPSGAEEGKYYRKETVKASEADFDDLNLKKASITVKDESGSTVYTKDREDNGKLSWTPDKDGKYTVTFDAEDKAGNTSSKTVTFTYDETPPSTKISSTDETGSCHKAPADVTASTEDKNPDKVYLTVKRTDQESGKTVTLQKEKEGDLQGSFKDFNEDGLYEVTAYSVDKAGNKSKEETFKVIKDTKAPDVSLSGAEEGKYYNKDSAKTSAGSVKDLNLKQAEITVKDENGSVVHTEKTASNGKLSWKPDKDGKYTVTVNAEDKAGNTSSKTVTFTYDATPPVTKVTSSDKSGSCHKAPANVNIATEDRNPDKVHLTVTRTDQATGAISTVVDDRVSSLKDVFSSFTQDGLYTVTAYSVDKAENKSKVETFKVIKDTQAPGIKFSGLKEGAYYRRSNRPTFTSSFSDLNMKESAITVKNEDGKTVHTESRDSNGNLSWTPSSDGHYTITAVSKDKAGNEKKKSISFVYDATNPATKITSSDKSGSCHRNPSDVSIKTEDKNPYSVYVTATRKDQETGRTVTLFSKRKGGKEYTFRDFAENGIYTISAYSVDKAGNKSSTKTFRVTKDTVKPAITLTGATNGKFYNKDRSMAAKIHEANLSSAEMVIRRNGSVVSRVHTSSRKGLEYEISKVISAEGKYEVEVTAEDKAGNSSSKSRKFTVDKTAPTTKITGAKRSRHYRQPPEITASSSEIADVHLTVMRDGKEVYAGSAKNAKKYAGYGRDGDYVVRAYSTDRAGNKGKTSEMKFTKDSTAPVISIHGAPSGSYQNKKTAVSVRVEERYYKTDQVKVNVTRNLNGKSYSVPFHFTSDGRVAVDSVDLSDTGKYTITATARDEAGNAAKKETLSFYVDQQKPKIAISAPSKVGAKSEASPKITIKDDYLKSHQITMKKIFGEGSGKESDFRHYDDIGSTGGKWVYNNLENKKANDGVYVIEVTAVDKSGNRMHERHTMIVDRYGSIFEISGKPSEMYMKEPQSDIIIKEVNAAGIKKHKVSVRRDGSDVEAVAKVTRKGYSNIYVIPRKYFKEEGIYRVNLITTDDTGNISESDKAKNGDIWFAIDRTPPAITLNGIESGKLYKQSNVRFYFSATDTISEKLKYHARVNGKDLPLKKENGRYYADLPKGYNMDVSITAEDQAGNVGKQEIKNVSVSSSPFAVLLAHRKALYTGLGVIAAAAAALVGYVIYRRKKHPNVGKHDKTETHSLDDDFEV